MGWCTLQQCSACTLPAAKSSSGAVQAGNTAQLRAAAAPPVPSAHERQLGQAPGGGLKRKGQAEKLPLHFFLAEARLAAAGLGAAFALLGVALALAGDFFLAEAAFLVAVVFLTAVAFLAVEGLTLAAAALPLLAGVLAAALPLAAAALPLAGVVCGAATRGQG